MPPELIAPTARSRAQRRLGRLLPVADLLPRPVHYVLAGGGSHGAVQWGLLQALSETDLHPDALIGTSAGALSGVVVAEDPTSGLNRLAYVWSQLNSTFLFRDSWLGRLGNARQQALADNSAERATLQSILHAETFAELELPFAAVATDAATGAPVVLDSGPLLPALLASTAIPGLFPPVTIDGRVLFDGLASANLPAMPAVRAGAGSVVVLDTGGSAPTELRSNARGVIARLGQILSAAQRRDQLRDAAEQVPVVLLPTPGDLAGLLDFGDTMRSAAGAYRMAREFLLDLVGDHDGPLPPGLYAATDGPAAARPAEVLDEVGA